MAVDAVFGTVNIMYSPASARSREIATWPAAESEFRLAVTPGLVAVGLSWAVIIVFLGALFPAIRAARLPIATALRRP
jgi:ABC-type lipoprotein release transport system permease subunit